jgi:predicted heme/steroid binding protein
MTDRIITLAELRRNNGDRGTPLWVAHKGIVYDVSECGRWKKGIHEGQHFPGQDLTDELEHDAPHDDFVFKNPCVKIVGTLER